MGDDVKLDGRTAALLSAAKRQWERTFDAIAEPLMILDGGYVIRRANLALAETLGVPIQKVVGARCHELRASSAEAFPRKPGQPCDGCPVDGARGSGVPTAAEMQTNSGRIQSLRAYPLADEGVTLTVCSYEDVTEKREMTRQLANAEKLAAIGRLAGGVAHEINNPLGGILAFAQILQRDDVTPAERIDFLKEIERSALRCKAVVESLLRFARQQTRGEPQPLELNDVVRDGVHLVDNKYASHDVRIECRLEADLPQVVGSRTQLQQLLVILLSNAFDSVGGPGRIEVETARRGSEVLLRVMDDGAGIPEAHRARIFDPFFTTKEEGKGTGLGLAVSYAIVQEHGGRIEARNRPGGGAEFSVYLPVAGTRSASAAT